MLLKHDLMYILAELVLPNGATQLDTRYLIKTADEEPAYLVCTLVSL